MTSGVVIAASDRRSGPEHGHDKITSIGTHLELAPLDGGIRRVLTMAAYVVVDTKIHDPDGYERYKALARPIAERFGGEYLVRGAEIDLVDDDLWAPTRIVIVRFPDHAAARAFIDSDEYAPVQAMRHRYADSTLLIVDGD